MKSLAALTLLAFFFANTAIDKPQEKPASLKLDSLAWIAGHWRQESGSNITEELWMPARGGMMLGLNRSVKGEKLAGFEYLRIQEDSNGVTYLASPRGTKPTPFQLTKSESGHAVFENPKHDFPTKIEYRMKDNKLVASIAGENKPGPSWTFVRVGDIK